MKQLMDKINNLQAWQGVIVLVVVGIATFFTGLTNPFQGDDSYQIVNNLPVHSFSNFFEFFGSSTFFNGQNLTGIYYRPIMTVTFSLIYTLFGAHPIAFHIVQLGIFIASAAILYLVFRHFFKDGLALGIALVFVVHPLNSQIVYSIPTMQDALFFFFGVSALWLLIKYKSTRILWGVAALLFSAMLSKESGFIFTLVALLYLTWYDRSRLKRFVIIMVLPTAGYLLLKINAVGIVAAQHAAPIDGATLVQRLFTAPSIVLFYFTKLLFPWKLSTGYYWLYTKFSLGHVLLPLAIDFAIVALLIYGGWRMHQRRAANFRTYVFFASWVLIGILPYLQILKLDMTASETWFYFAMSGLLGMLGSYVSSVRLRISPVWSLVIIVLIVGAFSVRSGLRGLDYRSQYHLAMTDLEVSQYNPSALNNVSQYLNDNGKYAEAAVYARRSINIYPVVSSYINLGVALQQLGKYDEALQAYNTALKYGNLSIIYENMALINLLHSSPASTNQFFLKALSAYPHDYKLWLYYAVFSGAIGQTSNAKLAIANAAKYGQVPQLIYNNIMNDQPFLLPIQGKTILVR